MAAETKASHVDDGPQQTEPERNVQPPVELKPPKVFAGTASFICTYFCIYSFSKFIIFEVFSFHKVIYCFNV